MPEISAWQCPYTGRVFGREEYKRYLRKLRNKRSLEFKQKTIEDDRAKFFKNMRDTCYSAADIEEFILRNWDTMRDMAFIRKGIPNKGTSKLLTVRIEAQYGERCSNTHCSPFGGVTNWYWQSDRPKGYPGYSGNLEMVFDEYDGRSPNVSDVLEGSGINTGSGGGGRSVRYSVIFFLDDWPRLSEVRMEKLLKDESSHAL